MTRIELVAHALARYEHEKDVWDDLSAQVRINYMGLALAAIREMKLTRKRKCLQTTQSV